MEKERVYLQYDKKFVKKRMKRFAITIIPILLAVCILYIRRIFFHTI
jgi:hypothetical protein